jgi:DNA polymerase delta subunit 4
MTRLERWERAESFGLNPPNEVRFIVMLHLQHALIPHRLQVYEILMTKQGQVLDEYKQSVFHGEV